MTVGALIGWAILSVVTSIVAKKALHGWHGRRFKEYSGQGLCGRQDDPSSLPGYLGGGTAKESVFLRKPKLWYEGVGRGRWSRGDS